MERFNRTLADRLFTYQYHKELEDPSKSNREWVSRLQNVVSALNNEKARLYGMKPVDAINKTNDLILNLTPENVTQHSRIE